MLNKPEVLFLILGVIFGLAFMIISPPLTVADGSGHLKRAIEVSNGILYNKTPAKFTKTDVLFLHNEKFSKYAINDKHFHHMSGYSPINYLASAMGIKIGYLFKNVILMFYLARLFNLFVWLALIYFAIRITPVFKWHFSIFALLPMNVYEGMSLAADSFVNSFSFLFFAYMFKLIFEKKEKLSNLEISGYAIFTFISAFLKGCLIYPAFLMFFVKDRRKIIISVLVITLCGLLGSIWIFNNHIAAPFANQEYNRYILLTKPYYVIYIVFKTMLLHYPYYIQGIIARPGQIMAKMPICVYICTVIIYMLNFKFVPCEQRIDKRYRIFAAGLILLFCIIMLCQLFFTWTPVGSFKVGGFQGRYLIFLLPLYFLIFSENPDCKTYDKFKIFTAFYVICLLTYFCCFLSCIN